MKNSALAGFLSVILTLLAVIMLISAVGFAGKSVNSRNEDLFEIERVTQLSGEYSAISEELSVLRTYKEMSELLADWKDEHKTESSEHRSELAVYTATRSGLLSGMDLVDEYGWVLYLAWDEYRQGRAQFNAALAQNGMTEADIPSDAALDIMEEVFGQLDAGMSNLKENLDALLEMQTAVEALNALNALRQELKEQYDAARSAYDSYKEEFYNALADGGLEQYGLSAETLAELKAACDALEAQFQDLEERIDAISSSLPLEPVLSASLAMIQDLQKRYDELNAQYEQGRAFLQGLRTLRQTLNALNEAEAKLTKSQLEIDLNVYEINRQLEELDEQALELEAERDRLDEDYSGILGLSADTSRIKALENSLNVTGLKLKSRQEIADAVNSGESIAAASDSYVNSLKRKSIENYVMRLFMIACLGIAAFSFFMHLPAAFEKLKSRPYLFITLISGLFFSALAFLISLKYSNVDSYIAIICVVLAFFQLIAIIPQKITLTNAVSDSIDQF